MLKFPEEFHEYRFDWLPDRVDFYVDGLLMLTESQCVPNTLGTLALRHFEDNGRDGPPAQDAVMTVGYVKAYYNATTRDEAKPGCKNLDGSVCIIPNQNIPPNPDGKKTHFYSQWLEDHKDDDPKPNDVGHGWDWDEENSAAVFSAGLLVASFLLILACGLL